MYSTVFFGILSTALFFASSGGIAQPLDPCPACGSRSAKFEWNESQGQFEVDTDVGNAAGVSISNVQTDQDGEPVSGSWQSSNFFICAIVVKAGNNPTTTITFPDFTSSGTFSTDAPPAISNLTFCGDIVIAVELTSFTAQATAGTVTLTWTTATETENLGFNVYRSNQDAEDYVQINEKMIPGAGNSAEAHTYSYIDHHVEPSHTYYYKLADVDFNGNVEFHGPVSVTVETLPKEYSLAQNYPNPFNPKTAMKFTLKEAGEVSLKIYNLQGKLVRMLVSGYREAGSYSVMWNGTDPEGRVVAGGVYLYKLEVNGFSDIKRMVFMK